MLQNRPVSIIIVGSLVIGSFCAIWPCLLNRTLVPDEAKEQRARLNRNLLQSALVCLLLSWIMTILAFL
jgi:hypothetical protein